MASGAAVAGPQVPATLLLEERSALALNAVAGLVDDDTVLRGLGAAAYHLETSLRSGQLVGVSSRSASLLATVELMRAVTTLRKVRVVQILSSLMQRTIGIDIDQLRKTPHCVCVAGGLPKAEAIHGALRAGFIDVLVTDKLAAEKLLADE